MSGVAPGAEAGQGSDDPLAALMADVAAGHFLPSDGGVTTVPPDRTTGAWAALSFTGHAVVVSGRTRDEVLAAGVDGIEGVLAPDVLRRLVGPDGWIGVVDVVMTAPGRGVGSPLRETDEHDSATRVRYARATRSDVRVLADDDGLVTIGHGLGGRWELGFGLLHEGAPPGTGRRLVAHAIDELPVGSTLFASCAPGNARSLRALLAAGFTVVGAEVLLSPRARDDIPFIGETPDS